jgi:hypothetical protein
MPRSTFQSQPWSAKLKTHGAANKAVVEISSFLYASGILGRRTQARISYEIMRAKDVGWSANKIVLGRA